MASTFPTALDTFTNPTGTNLLTSPDHALQHSDINDAVEALEAKVAIGNTVLGVYTAYTPTWANLTVGNGTVTTAYARVNDFVHYFGKIVFGSTSAITGSVSVSLPVNLDANIAATTRALLGIALMRDVSAGAQFLGNGAVSTGSATTAILEVANASGTYSSLNGLSSTVPMTWANTDILFWNLYYKAA
jgi:hypothetical protein